MKKYDSGPQSHHVHEFQQVTDENIRFKKFFAELRLDKALLEAVSSKTTQPAVKYLAMNYV